MKKITVRYLKPPTDIIRLKKVSAYCRVSTKQEIQERSLEVQKAYFNESIPKKPDWIFAWRATGLSLRAITAELKEHGIPSPRGNPVWHIETVRKILNNEKYYGDVLLQKTYVSDYFTGKQSPNNGELDQYLIEGHHKGIVK